MDNPLPPAEDTAAAIPPAPRSGRPWWGLAAMTAAMLALILWAAGPHLASAFAPATPPNPAANAPAPSPGLAFTLDLNTDKTSSNPPPADDPAQALAPAAAQDANSLEAPPSDTPSLRHRLGSALSKAKDKGASLIKPDAPSDSDSATPNTAPDATDTTDGADAVETTWKQRIRNRLGQLKNVAVPGDKQPNETDKPDGKWTLTFGTPPSASTPAPANPLESILVLTSLAFSGLTLLLATLSEIMCEPRWVGIAAAATGGVVILAYLLALIATALMALLAIVILAAIIGAFANGVSV